jgi:hypothetical protein
MVHNSVQWQEVFSVVFLFSQVSFSAGNIIVNNMINLSLQGLVLHVKALIKIEKKT